MACTTFNTCNGEYEWNWVEVFDKFGFNDGDGQVETGLVASALNEAGYEVALSNWSFHNTVIYSIKKDGCEFITDDQSKYSFGYDCPRTYLPQEIIDLLDDIFPPTN